MRIFTGYYGNMKAYRGMTFVGISLGTPKWISFDFPKCRELNPKPYMLHMENEQYTAAYKSLLAKLDPQKIVDFLESVSNGKDVVLLCYEKPGDFCHRQLVAEWLNEKLNLNVQEFVKPNPPEKENIQLELF